MLNATQLNRLDASCLPLQRLPCGVVLWHHLLTRRLAAGRAPPHLQGIGGGAAGGAGGCSTALRAPSL